MKRILVGLAAGLLVAHASLATPVDRGSFSSTFFDFQVTEATDQVSDPTDPDVLYGAPIELSSGLLFTPTNFIAASTDGVSAGGSGTATDNTNSLLQIEIMSKNVLNPIDLITISESGDTTLGGSVASTQIGAGGIIKILEIDGVEAPVSVLLADIPIEPVNFTGGTAISNGALFFTPTNTGTTNWTGSVTIDMNAVLAGLGETGSVTKALVLYDNNLTATSNGVGDSAQIQKKSNLIVEVIPEPGTGMLVALGLVAIAVRRR